MWSILMGLFLLVAGIAGILFTPDSVYPISIAVLGAGFFVWGIVQFMQLPEETADSEPERDEDSAPPTTSPPPQQTIEKEEKQTVNPRPVAPEQKEMKQGGAKAHISSKEAQEAPPQGEKVVRLANSPQEAPTPYQRGLRYMHAMDRQTGHRKAAGCFVEGYEKGDLNAAYMLCHCYKEGKGVPVKPAFVVQLAEYLVRKRYYPAYCHLIAAYREGVGVPMNLTLAAEYAKKFEEYCSSPIEGIDELIRYDALISYETQKDEPDLRTLERLARENYAISHLPSRYSILALALLRDARCSASARAEVQRLLEDGSQADDVGCYYLRGLLMCSEKTLLYAHDMKRGIEHLHLAADRLGSSAALHSYLHYIEDSEHAAKIIQKYWDVCRWGISGLQGSDELHCHISLISQDACTPEEDRSGRPYLLLENKSEETLHGAIIRICCIDKKLDISIKLAPLAPGERTEIHPEEHQLELGKRLYVEVLKADKCSRLYIRNTNILRKLMTNPELL